MSKEPIDIPRIPRNTLSKTAPVRRDPWIVERCKGRKVLHVGCTDYPFTAPKFANGTLLHQEMAPVAAKLVGIDLDEPSIRFLTEKGVPDLHVVDAANVKVLLEQIGFEPDLVVAGEVIEHLNEPQAFLRGLRSAMSERASLIVSIPNAFHYLGIINILLGREKVHPDHVAYYSVGTITETLRRAGFRVVDIQPYNNGQARLWDRICHAPFVLLTRFVPHLSIGYVVEAHPA